MLGGGNPVSSSNPAGVGTSINYVGNHCYANSGAVSITSGTTKELLKFNTGNAYIDAVITGGRNMKAGAETTTEIKLDGSVVFSSKYDNGTGQTLVPPFNTNIYILIPPNTNFVLECSPEDANETISILLTGRVYQ